MILQTLEDQMNTSGRPLELFAHTYGLAIPTETADAPVPTLVVNHGRWICRCPFCRGAELASANDHRFLCGSCRNQQVGGRWLRVVWPDNAAELETVLSRRADIDNRNWEPGETIADLLAENDAHGVA